MKKIAMILLFLCSIAVHSQQKRYVLNNFGTEFKKSPSWNSETLEILNPGDSLEVLKSKVSVTEKSVLNDGLFLKGFWIEANHHGKKGYVFEGDLTAIKPEIIKDDYDKGRIWPSIKGKLLTRTDSILKLIYRSTTTYEVEQKYTVYQNVLYKYYEFDGCFNYEYSTKKLSFNEFYHLMLQCNVIYSDKADGSIELEFAKFKKKEGNVYHFQEIGASTDLQIEVKKDGSLVLSWYSCT